jgi:CDP-diacylglycerol--glycerol-3-phosphate 3-phosphatidyltransferase/cardiolipin synthase
VPRDRLWTLPNIISLSRLGLAVAFVLTDDVAWRLALVGIATTTDYLDGWLARRRKYFSPLGALIDAGTDRAFVATAIATLAVDGTLTSFQVFVFLSRDLATAVAFLVARFVPQFKGVTFVARFPGKVVTVLQLLALAVAIAAPRRVDGLITVLAVASVVAIADYAFAFWKARAH